MKKEGSTDYTDYTDVGIRVIRVIRGSFFFFILGLAPLLAQDCLGCHADKIDETKWKASIHAMLECGGCHTDIKGYPHPAKIARPTCNTCHADTMKEFRASVHGRDSSQDGPACSSCHGPVHTVVAHTDAASPVAKKNLPATCATCHSNPDFLRRHKIELAMPVESFSGTVHGRAVAAGNDKAASCSDCHSSHNIMPGSDARSKTNHFNVPATCGACHAEIQKVYADSVHGQAVARKVRGAPVCTDCHGEHRILAPSEAQSLVNPARVSSVTCGRCHADERLSARFNMPADRLETFQDSFHGLSSAAGSTKVANCASCHGVHNILASSDPRSTVSPANLAKTCGSCHPGAGERFAIGAIHTKTGTSTEHASVKIIRWGYWLIIPATLGFMLLHNLIDWLAKLRRPRPRFAGGEQVERMNLHFRMAHWLVMVSFTILVVTGFALKFPESWWAAPIVRWEGQMALRGWVHRIAAVILVTALVYHIIHLIVRRRDRKALQYLVPDFGDAKDILAVFKYNLGLSSERPTFGVFNYAEKMEYWAFMWGTVVMAVSGFLLWFNNFTLRYFPKWVTDAATAIHYYEAILATLAILIWHGYMVIFDPDIYPMDTAWLNGKVPAEHLKHARPEYYARLVGVAAAPEPPPATEPEPSKSE